MDNEYIVINDGELYHWGIKGMRWGVRRYQNKDGSLTAAGKKRLKAENDKLKAREEVIKNKEKNKARVAKLAAKKAELDAREEDLKGNKSKTKSATKSSGDSAAPKKKSIKDLLILFDYNVLSCNQNMVHLQFHKYLLYKA